MRLEPPVRLTPETVMVWPEIPTLPVLAAMYPGSALLVLGALQPAGTTRATAPLVMPPEAAV